MMRYLVLFLLFLSISCNQSEEGRREDVKPFSKVLIDFIHTDSISIRAIAIGKNEAMYVGSNGNYGYYDTRVNSGGITKGTIDFLGRNPSFRAIANTTNYFFMLSIESPALLYRYDKKANEVALVYTDENENAFYDSMSFWNDDEGIAMGDPTEDCLSILITRDGGNTWNKLDCSVLPKIVSGEAAFAASDTNIKTLGNLTWIISGGARSRVFYSDDKGASWEVFETPIIQGLETQGGYSIDFYDENHGIIYGGDYTNPDQNSSNIAATQDGGRTWELIAQGKNEGYKSCVQYVPNTKGKEIIATGFTGISYSNDAGLSWKSLSDAPFLTLRFVNDSIAYAGGRNVFARLIFKR